MEMTTDGREVIGRLHRAVKDIGWSETSRRCGIDRTALHRAFKNGRMRFDTIAVVAKAVGLKLVVY